MVRKKAKDLKKSDKVTVAGKKFTIQAIEISDIGKQGKRKVRLELKDDKGESLVIIRPDDYPLETE